jgi:hypothetical protein
MTTMNAERNRPPFKVRGTATIKNLNVRKEGPEDERVLACDIKLEWRTSTTRWRRSSGAASRTR